MIGSNFHGIIGAREICNHNLRFRVPSKSNICLICHCNKIEDILSTDCGGKRKLSSTNILEIIHQFRVLNSVLDVPIDASLVETLLSPVLKTSLAALKVHNDEVGAFVAQGLEKISPKVPKNMLESFLEKLSAQMLEKTSSGDLDCLTVLFRQKECLNNFLKNQGTSLLPSLLQLLEKHVQRIIFKPPALPSSLSKIRQPSSVVALADSSAEYCWKESLRILEKLFDVLEASCPTDIALVVTDNENGGSQHFSCAAGSEECFQIFRQCMKETVGACMNLLSSSHSSESAQMAPFHIKVLRFLEKLHHHAETLCLIFADSVGVALCSTIKKLLYTHSVDVKTAALSLVNRMLVTYQHATEDDSCADKAILANFPSVISQVDLIHFITEAMNTSSEALFRMVLEVLDRINSIPLFRQGRMVPVLETTLRVSTMRIPDNIVDLKTYISLNSFLLNILTSLENVPSGIYRQLMYLFERLPKEWTVAQYLPWIKLLVFCGREAELQGNLWNAFVSFVKRSKNLGNRYSVTPLKCVLLIAYALMECKAPPTENDQTNMSLNKHLDQNWKILLLMMDMDFLPALMALFQHGTAEDSIFTIILLDLLKMYPLRYLNMESSSLQPVVLKTCMVEYDSLLSTETWSQEHQDRNTYQVVINEPSVVKMADGFWCWTPKVLMEVLGIIRLNSDFMTNRQLFELWNENISRIIAQCGAYHLPQLYTTLDISNICLDEVCEEEPSLENTLKVLVGQLDIDMTCWIKILEQDAEPVTGVKMDKNQLQDVVLAFYFCYALYVGKDIVHFIDPSFANRLTVFLENTVEKYNETQEVQAFGWEYVSLYFRVGLMIASVLPRNSKDLIALYEKFKLLELEVNEFGSKFKYDVMVYHHDVFILILREHIYPATEELVEIWLDKDRAACISFFTNTNVDEQLNLEINNSILAMALRGNRENGRLAVELSNKRLKKFKIGFEFPVFLQNLQYTITQILRDERSERSRNSINLLRLSNVMQLAVQDEFFLSPENPFPSDFLRQVIMIMLKFHDLPLIGRKSLELLSKIFRDDMLFEDVSQYNVSYKDFVCYLGTKLHEVDRESPEELIYAQKLLTLLIRRNLQQAGKYLDGVSEPLIKWKLTSVISYIHEIPKVEILEFVLIIFKINFKCELIQVEEMSSPSLFASALLNLLLHVQALTHKVVIKAAKDLVWEILCEFIRLASDKRIVIKQSFQSQVLFQPWMKVLVADMLTGCTHVPSRLDLKQLEFLQGWTNLMLKSKLENPTKRSSVSEQMVFGPYLGLFKTIMKDMKEDRTQVVVLKGKENVPIPPRSTMTVTKHSRIFDIEQKTKVIAQIAKTCDTFVSSF